MNYDVVLCYLLASAGILAQIGPADWTNFASLPFAFAAASFLIWSIVGLVRMLFDSWKQTNTETIATLRDQVAGLRKFQEDTLAGMIAKVTTAMEQDADAARATCEAWSGVHEDFRSLINALRTRPCLHESDFPDGVEADEKTLATIERRQRRVAEREGGGT